LESRTQSTRTSPAGNARAGWAVAFALLSVATMPAAIVGTRFARAYRLLDAGYAIPLALLLGVGALVLARSARQRDERALGRLGGSRAIRLGRVLGTIGVCLAVTALISVSVYALLQYLAGRG